MRDFSLDEAVYWGLGGLKMDRMLGLSLGSYERDPRSEYNMPTERLNCDGLSCLQTE